MCKLCDDDAKYGHEPESAQSRAGEAGANLTDVLDAARFRYCTKNGFPVCFQTGWWSWLLRFFGYYRIDYGFSCGRHWMTINGKTIAQTAGDAVWMRDEDVHRLGYAVLDHGKHWTAPNGTELTGAASSRPG